MLCLKWPRPYRFFLNNRIQILWIFFAAKMIFEIYNAYNIMIMRQVMRKKKYACAKTKAKISLAVTSARLISAFVFDLRIVHSLYFLNKKVFKL